MKHVKSASSQLVNNVFCFCWAQCCLIRCWDTSSGWSLNVANRHCQFIVVVLTLHTLQSFAVQRRIGSRWGSTPAVNVDVFSVGIPKWLTKPKPCQNYETLSLLWRCQEFWLIFWRSGPQSGGPAKQSEKERSDRTLQSDAVSGNLLRTRLEPEFRLFKSTRLNGYSCRGCLSLAVLSPSIVIKFWDSHEICYMTYHNRKTLCHIRACFRFPSLLALQPTKKEGMFDSLWTWWYLIPSACWVNFKQHQTPDTQIGNDNAIVPWD